MQTQRPARELLHEHRSIHVQAAPVRRLPTRAVTHPAATLDAKSATLLQTLLSGTDTAPHLDNPRSPRRRPQTRTQAGKNANSAGFNSGLSSNNGGGASSGGGTLVSDNKGSNSQLPGRAFQPHQHRALVLDKGYRPINVVPWSRAVQLDVLEKAEILDYYPAPACAISGRGEHPLPSVMRVHTNVSLHDVYTRVSCTRRNVLVRDKFCCQYCGQSRDLTLDHVVPVSRGGKDTWNNLVTACASCNQKKAHHLLHELGWKLKNEPREPTPYELGVVVGLSYTDLESPPPAWEPYISHYRERKRKVNKKLRALGEAVPGWGEPGSSDMSGACLA